VQAAGNEADRAIACRAPMRPMFAHRRGQGIDRRTRQAPRPLALSPDASSRRHADPVEARPTGPQLARPGNDAGRPPRPLRGTPSVTETIDTATPTGRATWQMIGAPAKPEKGSDFGTHPRRGEGSATPRREVCQKTEPNTRPDRARPAVDRKRRTLERGPFDALSGARWVPSAHENVLYHIRKGAPVK
jgi:hypothetical protein